MNCLQSTHFLMYTFFLLTRQLHKKHDNPQILIVDDSPGSNMSDNDEPADHEVFTIYDLEGEKEMEISVDNIEVTGHR